MSQTIKDVPQPSWRILRMDRLRVDFWDYPARCAPFWFCHWHGTAGGIVEAGDHVWDPGPDELLLIPPYTVFSTRLRQPFEHFYLHFTIEKSFDGIIRRPIAVPVDPASVPDRRTDALRCYTFLGNALTMIPAEAFGSEAGQGLDERLMRSIAALRGRSGENWSNRNLAAQANMSVSHFTRLFRRELGQTPQTYRMHEKLEEARHLLAENNLSIDEIAEITGFADRSCMSKAFARRYGEPPGKFRQKKLQRPL